MTEATTQDGMLGKYRILGTLGRGSMGVVYKAEDPSIGRVVAIKTLRKIGPSKFQDAETALDRFRTEARSAGRLRHPNIITIFDASINDDTPFIVMDYVEGSSLESVIHAEGRIAPKRAMHLLRQLAEALDEAHRHGVIHRDIKPSNIVVDATDRLYVLDFGVAKLNETIQEEIADAQKEPIMGTPAYMSPEQILNRGLGKQSDIFSFSLVAYEVLSGSRPFPGETFNEVVNSILHNSPIPITSLVADFPLQLEVEFEHALAKNPDERPESASEVVRVLSKALDIGLGVGTGKSGIVGGQGRARKPSEWKSIGSIPPGEGGESKPDAQRFTRTSGPHERPSNGRNNPSAKELVPLQQEKKFGGGQKVTEQYSMPGAAPGDVFSHQESDLQQNVRFRREFSFLRTFVLTLAVFFISISSFVLYSVLRGEDPLEALGFVEEQVDPQRVAKEEAKSRKDIIDGNVVVIRPNQIPTNLDPTIASTTALSELSDQNVLAVLAAESTDVKRKLDALTEVGVRKLPGLLQLAPDLLSHENYVVRIETVKNLGELRNRDAAPLLIDHLSDHDPLVRREIAEALGKLGSLKSVPYLKRFYESEENSQVREAIKVAVEKISGLPMKGAG